MHVIEASLSGLPLFFFAIFYTTRNDVVQTFFIYLIRLIRKMSIVTAFPGIDVSVVYSL